jgi:hypothetical protein
MDTNDIPAIGTPEADAVVREMRAHLKLTPELPSIEAVVCEGVCEDHLHLIGVASDGAQFHIDFPRSEIDREDPNANERIAERVKRIAVAAYN